MQKMAFKKLWEYFNTNSHFLPTMKSTPVPSSFSHVHIKKCYSELALAGMKRCTYDWLSHHSTPWNKAVITVLLDNWQICMATSKSSTAYTFNKAHNNEAMQTGVLEHWLCGKKKAYRKQLLVPEPPPGEAQPLSSPKRAKIYKHWVCFSTLGLHLTNSLIWASHPSV